jgi:hypothetical protein
MTAPERNEADRLVDRARKLLPDQPASSVLHLERALELDPGHPRAVESLAALAEAYLALNRFRECGFLYESCVQLEPLELRHHVRLCAFRATRAHYRKAAEGLRRYLDMGGTPSVLERQLLEQQHPRSVVRALRALCDVLQRVDLAKLPTFRTMGDIVAFEERFRSAERPSLGSSLDRLPGVSPDAASRLHAAGLGTVTELAAASVPDLMVLGFTKPEAEALVDVANSEVYLANTQAPRPAERR